jgi:hypothetical protein
MKIIDKTPLLDEKGELGMMQRIQGMLKFGFGWPNELDAQKAIITFFDRQLEKGYTLIRNMTLGASGITVPLILVGPSGIYVIHVTYLRGRYEARGTSWNEASGNGYKPASVNLIQRTARMANAVKAFVERQGVKLPVEIEPVLIAGNPGLHIESVRPAIKVIMIDGIKSFASNLTTARPVMSVEVVHELADRIVNPRMPRKEAPAPPVSEPSFSAEEKTLPPSPGASRASTIFNATKEEKPFESSGLDFAMFDEEPASASAPPSVLETSPAQPLPRRAPQSKRTLGMTRPQLLIVAGLIFVFLCVLAVVAYILITSFL